MVDRNANYLTAIEVAAQEKNWDTVEYLLERGFKCEGVEKLVYVGEVKNGKRHGHGKSYRSNGEVYVGEWRDDTPSNIYLSSEALNENIQQLSLNPQPGPRQSLQDKFFAYVEQGDVGQASQLFTNNKTNLDKNARNANGLTAIEVAVKKYQWDMLEWLLDNFFECWGVGKIEGRKYGGYVYVGEVRNGQMHGHGRCTYSSGSVYEGEWKNGDWHGHGKYTYPGGSAAEGRYELNVFMQPEPRPPSTNSNHRESLQDKFFAYVEQGNVGQASQLFTKNKTYLDKNARNANGLTAIEVAVKKYHWDMLEWLLDRGFKCWGVEKIKESWYVYVGEVIDGKENGHGKMTYPDGIIYEGEYKNGYRHGHGKATYADGSVKEGRWEYGAFKDGSFYEGEWKNGRYHGHGRYTYPDGRVEDGRWEYGYFEG